MEPGAIREIRVGDLSEGLSGVAPSLKGLAASRCCGGAGGASSADRTGTESAGQIQLQLRELLAGLMRNAPASQSA